MTQDTFTEAMERFRDAEDAFSEQAGRMREDAEFSNPADPKQWDDTARNIRERGPDGARPCLTLDHTNQYVRQVINDARQNKPAIDVLPAGSGSRIEVARAVSGMIRHIEYRSRAQIAYDTAIENAARMGIGWIRVMPEVVNEKLNWQEVRICRVHNPLAIVPDPSWKEPDGSDIGWIFAKSSMPRADFKKRWPKAADTPFDERGVGSVWFQQHTIRVAEYLCIEEQKQQRFKLYMPDGSVRDVADDSADEAPDGAGFWKTVNGELGGVKPDFEAYDGSTRTVCWRIMSGAEILEETDFPSRWTGFVPVVGNEVWIDEKRYLSGMVRSMMEAQRAYNYERSAWVEVVALQPKAPYKAASEAIEGHENEWAASNRTNKAFLPWNAYDEEGRQLPMPEREAPPAMPAAFAQGAQFADNDIQASVGMYRASLGAPTQEHSGIAIRAKQREGDTANFHYTDNQSRSIEMVGRIVLDMIPRLYDEARESRILGADGSVKPVHIDPKGSVYSVRPDGAETINLGTGEYDVRCKSGPSYTTLREEAADHLTQLMQGQPAIAAVVAPIWAQMQDWPQADKLAKALLAMAPPPVQAALNEDGAQDPQQLQQQLMQAKQQLEQLQQQLQQAGQMLQKAQGEQQKTRLDALGKAAQIKVDQYNAETARLKIMAPTLNEQAVEGVVARMLQEILGAPPLTGAGGPAPVTPDMTAPTDSGPLAPPDPTGQGDPSQTPSEPPQGGFSSPDGSVQ